MDLCVCGFCGKDESQVKKMISSTDSTICSECISTIYDALKIGSPSSQEGSESSKSDEDELFNDNLSKLKPKDIYNKLDEYIIGNPKTKKIISVNVFNHYKRIIHLNKNKSTSDVQIPKSNILMIGETGSGKTLFAQILGKILDVPVAISDATSLTEAGYVGDDVENVLTRLIELSNGNIKKAQNGIVYIDEIDKIAKRSSSSGNTRDISGEGVQQALLKIIEGTVANVPKTGSKRSSSAQMISFDTSNILFMFGGAFVGLNKIIQNRNNVSKIGFSSNLEKDNIVNNNSRVTQDDLFQYGLIPELVGRISVITELDKVTEELMHSILTEPKNSLIKQYVHLFELDNIRLDVTKEACIEIAKAASKKKVGARALKYIIEEVLLDTMFNAPSDDEVKRVVLSKEMVIKYLENTAI